MKDNSKANTLFVLAVALAFILFAAPMFAKDSSADPIYIEFVDSEGHGLGDSPLIQTNVDFSTVNNSGEIVYYLEGNHGVGTSGDVFVRISSEFGKFNLNILAYTAESGSFGYLSQTGLVAMIQDGNSSYRAILDTNNHFESYLKDTSGKAAVLLPNVMYPLTFSTSSEYQSSVKPAQVSGLVFVFSIDIVPETRNIVFESEGVTVSSKELSISDEVGPLPEVSKEGYELVGWFDSEGKAVKETTKVYELSSDKIVATWEEVKKRTVSFVSEGEVVDTKTILPTVALGQLPSISREGYDFVGWFDSEGKEVTETTIVSDLPTLTVTASWKEIEKRTISYVSDGSVIATKNLLITDVIGAFPVVSKGGFDLEGWFDEKGTRVSETTKVSELPSDSVFASWKEAKKQTVSFVSEGEVVDTKTLPPTAALGQLPSVTREGYELVGWFDSEGKEVTKTTKVSELPTLIVTASWKEIEKRTISFVSEGNVVLSKTLAVTDELGQLPTVTRQGFTFTGWFDSANRHVSSTTKVSELSSDTIVAGWKSIEPAPGPSTRPTTTEKTEEIHNDDGTTTTTTTKRVIQPDGSYVETSTSSTVDPEDSSVTETVVTRKEVDIRGYTNETVTDTKSVVNDDGSTTTITKDTVKNSDGTRSETETTTTVNADGSSDETATRKETDSHGGTGESSTHTVVRVNEDGTRTKTTSYSGTESDGSTVTTESIEVYDQDGVLQEMNVNTVRSDSERGEIEVTATGSADRVDVIVSDLSSITMEYVNDAVNDLDIGKVVVGMHSDTGEIVVPQEVVTDLVDYGYGISVSTENSYVALDERVVSNLSSSGGQVTLRVSPATADNMSSYQISTVGQSYAIVVTLTVDGEPVSDLGGKAEISLDPGYQSASVYYVADDGSKEFIPSSYNPETGKVEFEVVHFSLYMVEMDGKSMPIQTYLLVLLVVGVLPVGVVIHKRRCKDEQTQS